jgi:hypothetical protein
MENGLLNFPFIELYYSMMKVIGNEKFKPDPSLKLMDQVRRVMRYYPPA